ncbi:MAG: sensor histidine kinase [Actinomycetia bacterium]|nr:sensor histidine kinase [Actinomycetes bacterium]
MIRTPWHRRLVTQAMALQLTVIALVLLAVSVAFARTSRDALEEQYGLRATAVAESVAEVPEVRTLLESKVISPQMQEIAEAVRLRTGVAFVVITDVTGVRHSHPKPERIGEPVSTDPSRALAGISDWYVQTGTLGPSVRGKVPVWDSTGEEVIGIVSVGVLTGEVSDAVRDWLAGLLLMASGVFAVGALAAYIAARTIRRQTLGLEPPEIAALYEHRDGMLRSLHEGVLAVDENGTVTLVNDEAATMLGLGSDSAGQSLDERPDLAELWALSKGPGSQVDVPLQIGTEMLLVTTAPITIRGKHQGAVYTFRDRTELQGLVSELESAQGLIEALRARAHEHSNSLHTISGLIELGRHDDVISIIMDHSASERALADLYGSRSGGDSLVIASLLAKAAIAAERDISLRTHIGDLPQTEIGVSRDLVTVVGNLVDNAIDHLSDTSIGGGEIEIAVWHDDGVVRIDVSDSGDGIPTEVLSQVFQSGYTTKDPRSHDGLGLALVDELVRRYRGSISVDSEPGSGTLFSVTLVLSSHQELIDV